MKYDMSVVISKIENYPSNIQTITLDKPSLKKYIKDNINNDINEDINEDINDASIYHCNFIKNRYN